MKRLLPLFVSLAMTLLGGIVFLIYFQPNKTSDTKKVYHIGILARGSGYTSAVDGYKKKMEELGYIEGENVVYDVRFISDKNKLTEAVKDFIRNKVDLIHTYSTPATQAAYWETRKMDNPIPVVFGSVGDPQIAGVVESIQKPSTNVTGVASLSTELTRNRLELLKEINPNIKKVAMPHTAKEAKDAAANKSVEIALDAAEELGIELKLYPVYSQQDNQRIAQSITSKEVQGIIIGGDSLIWGSIDEYIKQAKKEHLPLAVFSIGQVKKGALVGFGPDYFASGQQAAMIAHQIFQGKDPGLIPIQIPKQLKIALNKKTAKQIEIDLPQSFLEKVDIFIEE